MVYVGWAITDCTGFFSVPQLPLSSFHSYGSVLLKETFKKGGAMKKSSIQKRALLKAEWGIIAG